MTNIEALRAQCKMICSTCYADEDVLRLSLAQCGMEAEADAELPSNDIVRCALTVIRGWVETSRSEGGISVSIDMQSLRKSIMFWCGVAELDASEFLDDVSTIEDGTSLW